MSGISLSFIHFFFIQNVIQFQGFQMGHEIEHDSGHDLGHDLLSNGVYSPEVCTLVFNQGMCTRFQVTVSGV